LHQEITVRGGTVEQRSFPDYEMVRLENAPRVPCRVRVVVK
jgi:hypothetical protein